MRFGLRELILLLVLLVLPLSSYWLVFRPQNAEIDQAKAEIAHKRQMLDKLRHATAQNADLERANNEIQDSISKIEARLPTTKEIDKIVRQVSELAVEVGLGSPNMKSEKPLPAASYMEQPLAMAITGDFHGFYEFLLRLEQLPRITRIPDLNIKRSQQHDGHMEADFTLSIYFEDESAVVK
jgi:type IV pilus assembly protein PilO